MEIRKWKFGICAGFLGTVWAKSLTATWGFMLRLEIVRWLAFCGLPRFLNEDVLRLEIAGPTEKWPPRMAETA
jgi:hypothetical protein